ncbi:hypothetical protein N2152v2_003573 [Parachlorella kessleri]
MEGTVAQEQRREVQPAAQDSHVREGMQSEGAGQLTGAAEGQPAAEKLQGDSSGASQGPLAPRGSEQDFETSQASDEGQAAATVQQALGAGADHQPESPAGAGQVSGETMEVGEGTSAPATPLEAADVEARPAAKAAVAPAGPAATAYAEQGTDFGRPPETQVADTLADQGLAAVEAPALLPGGAAGKTAVPLKDGEEPHGAEAETKAAAGHAVMTDAADQPTVSAVPGSPGKDELGSEEARAAEAAKAAVHAGGSTAEQMPVQATAAAEAAVAAVAAEAAQDEPMDESPQIGGAVASGGGASGAAAEGAAGGDTGGAAPATAAAAAGPEPDGSGVPAVAAAVPAAAPAPPAPIIPGIPEEQHPLKPQWRRGRVGPKTEFLMVTVTQGDINSRRMRPPRHWYDSLMGGAFGVFEVEADVDGAQTKFYPQAHAYEYCKSEYYVQGSECKRLYKELNLQPGDGLVFRKGEVRANGVPSTKLTVMRVADNPHAAAILNSAASAQLRRAAAQADPNRRKTPKKKATAPGSGTGGIAAGSGASRKRKMAPVRAATDGMPSSFTPDLDAPQASRARRPVRNRRFPYGEDFVTGGGRQEFWDFGAAAAAAAEEDEEDREEGSEGPAGSYPGGSRDIEMGEGSQGEDAAMSDDSHGRGGPGSGSSPSRRSRLLAASGAGPAARPPPKSPLLAVAAAAHVHEQQQRQQQQHEPRPSPEKPRVTAMNIEGRNVLRIRLPFKRPAGQAGAGDQGAPSAAGKATGPQQAQHGGTTGAGAAVTAGAGPKAGGAGAIKSPKPRPAAAAGAKGAGAAAGAARNPPAGHGDDALDSLVALAAAAEDGIETGGRPEKKSGAAAAPRGDVTLLSKSLIRDGDGQVTGAHLKLAWDKERVAFSAITHHISDYGATHHDLATVEDFEVQPAEGQLRVTLRVAQAGRVDLLEKAVQQLVAML